MKQQKRVQKGKLEGFGQMISKFFSRPKPDSEAEIKKSYKKLQPATRYLANH